VLGRNLFRLGKIFFLFLIILLLTYSSYAFFRSSQFDNGLKKQNEKSNWEFLNAKQSLDTKYKNVDMSNGERRAEFEGMTIQYAYFYYLSFCEISLNNIDRKTLLFRLPLTVGRMHALERVMNLLFIASARSMTDSASEEEYVTEWMEKTGKQDTNWWNEFKQSKEYNEFIEKYILMKKNEKEETVHQVYQKIMNKKFQSNSILLDEYLNYPAIELERELAKESYKQYSYHIDHKEYYSALVDLNIIFEISNEYEKIEQYNLSSYLYINQQSFKLDFMRAQFLIDILIILFISINMTQIFFYFITRWISK